MFSYGNNEENYIVAMCQAGIMQGDYFDNNQFKSYSKVDGVTVAKVLSLVYNYDEVIKMCAIQFMIIINLNVMWILQKVKG